MEDYEDMILARQEDQMDECINCIYAKEGGRECRNQCMEIKDHYNPQLEKLLEQIRRERKRQRMDGLRNMKDEELLSYLTGDICVDKEMLKKIASEWNHRRLEKGVFDKVKKGNAYDSGRV